MFPQETGDYVQTGYWTVWPTALLKKLWFEQVTTKERIIVAWREANKFEHIAVTLL